MHHSIIILLLAISTVLMQVSAQSPSPITVCDTYQGVAGTSQGGAGTNWEFTLLPHFQLEPARGEALMFVVRPIPSTGLQQVEIRAKYQPANSALVQKVSDPSSGLLVITDMVRGSTIDLQVVAQANVASHESLPFTIFSFVSNSKMCAVQVGANRTFSSPILSGVVMNPNDNTQSNVVMFVKIPAPPAPYLHFLLNVGAGASQVEVRYALGDSSVIPASFTLLAQGGTATGDMRSAGQTTLYLQLTPTVQGKTTDVVSLTTDWTSSPVNPAPPPPGGGPTSDPNGGGGGWGTSTPAPEPEIPEGSLFGSFLLFIFFITIVYFVARSVYNYRNGVQTFPQFVPHHEEIGSAVTNVKDFVSGVATRGREGGVGPLGGQGPRRAGYDDVNNDPSA